MYPLGAYTGLTRPMPSVTMITMAKIRRRLAGVYILGSDVQGWFKIGSAYDIDNRTRIVRASLPFETYVVKKYLTEPRQKLEKFLHDRFSAMHLRAEWFACDAPKLVELCDGLVAEFKQQTPWTHTSVIEEPKGMPRKHRGERYATMLRKLAPRLNWFERMPLEKQIIEIERRLQVAKDENDAGAVTYLTGQLQSLRTKLS